MDPELARQMDAAGEQRLVGAAFSLRQIESGKPLSPQETQSAVRELIERVSAASGTTPAAQKVFPNLGYFMLTAAPPFLRKLIEQPEVVTATANRQTQDMLIKPVESRPVDLGAVKHDKPGGGKSGPSSGQTGETDKPRRRRPPGGRRRRR